MPNYSWHYFFAVYLFKCASPLEYEDLTSISYYLTINTLINIANI